VEGGKGHYLVDKSVATSSVAGNHYTSQGGPGKAIRHCQYQQLDWELRQ